MKPKNHSAVAYIRVSTSRQQAEGYSPQSQRAAIQAYAEAQGLDILQYFEESKSGFQNLQAREAYYSMIAFVAKNKISHVIYKFADRIARNLPDFVKLESLGVHLHNLERGQSFNPAEPDDYIFTADEERRIVTAKEESARTSKKVKDATRLMVAQGDYPGAIPPLGYCRNPLVKIGPKKRAGQIEIDQVTGPLVEKLFLLYRTGSWDHRTLATKMYDLGLRSRNGHFVNQSRIGAILNSTFYVGKFQFGGEESPVQGSYPPLISPELWEEVKLVREERGRNKFRNGKLRKTFKYHGLKCQLCGCSIVGETRHKILKSGAAASYTYYHCCQAKGKCDLGWFKEEEIDQYFSNAFADLEELSFGPADYEKARRILEAEDRENRNEARELLDMKRHELAALEAQGLILNDHLLSGAIKPDAYTEMREALKKRKAEVEARIAELAGVEESFIDVACDSLKLVSDFKAGFNNPNIRKRLSRLLFKTMSLEPKRVDGRTGEKISCLQLVYNEPFATLFQEYKTLFLEQEKLEEAFKTQEEIIWRGRRGSNSRPPA